MNGLSTSRRHIMRCPTILESLGGQINVVGVIYLPDKLAVMARVKSETLELCDGG